MMHLSFHKYERLNLNFPQPRVHQLHHSISSQLKPPSIWTVRIGFWRWLTAADMMDSSVYFIGHWPKPFFSSASAPSLYVSPTQIVPWNPTPPEIVASSPWPPLAKTYLLPYRLLRNPKSSCRPTWRPPLKSHLHLHHLQLDFPWCVTGRLPARKSHRSALRHETIWIKHNFMTLDREKQLRFPLFSVPLGICVRRYELWQFGSENYKRRLDQASVGFRPGKRSVWERRAVSKSWFEIGL